MAFSLYLPDIKKILLWLFGKVTNDMFTGVSWIYFPQTSFGHEMPLNNSTESILKSHSSDI